MAEGDVPSDPAGSEPAKVAGGPDLEELLLRAALALLPIFFRPVRVDDEPRRR